MQSISPLEMALANTSEAIGSVFSTVEMQMLGAMANTAVVFVPGGEGVVIGDFPAGTGALVNKIWKGEQPVSALPGTTRRQLECMYSKVAARNPATSAQSLYNQARADYLGGRGPNPGPTVTAFAEQHGITMGPAH